MGFFDSIGAGISGALSTVGQATGISNLIESGNQVLGGIDEKLFGTQTKEAGVNAANAASAAAAKQALTAEQKAAIDQEKADYYDKATREAMGTGVEDYLGKQDTFAKKNAEESAVNSSTQGTKAALKAARSSGLNKGQSSLVAAQQAGDIYSGAYNQGLNTGRDRYVQSTSQFGNAGSDMSGRSANQQAMNLGATNTQANIAQNQIQNAQNQSAQTWGTAGQVAGVALQAAAMSDERTKTNVFDVDRLKSEMEQYQVKPAQNTTKNNQNNDLLMKGIAAVNGKTMAKPASPTGGVAVPDAPTASVPIEVPMPAVSAPSAVVSDERTKTNVNDIRDKLNSIDVFEIANKIRPVQFNYKEGVENIDPKATPETQHLGVMAQDLENTALAPAVITGTDGLKRIDTTELTPALLNMIIQLASEVQKIKGIQ